MSLDDINKASTGVLGRVAQGVLLTVLIGLGSYQLNITQTLNKSHYELAQRVTDLHDGLTDKYNEIKGRMEEHYRHADNREDSLTSALGVLSTALNTQSIELAEIKQQLEDAKAQEKIDIERTSLERRSERQQTEQIPHEVVSIPVIGPIIQAITGKHKARTLVRPHR